MYEKLSDQSQNTLNSNTNSNQVLCEKVANQNQCYTSSSLNSNADSN